MEFARTPPASPTKPRHTATNDPTTLTSLERAAMLFAALVGLGVALCLFAHALR